MTHAQPLRLVRQKSVGCLVVNRRGQLLLLWKRQERFWDFVKGQVDRAETEHATLVRELGEETGIKRFRLVPRFRHVIHYRFRREDKLINKVGVFYLLHVAEPSVQLSVEHSRFRWCRKREALRLVRHHNYRRLINLAAAHLDPSTAPRHAPPHRGNRRAH